jgi:hypothetical protein
MKKIRREATRPSEKTLKTFLLRERNISFLLNDYEFKALQKYCTKYKIRNRSRFVRESVMKTVLTRLSEDYPTLFGENEMR